MRLNEHEIRKIANRAGSGEKLVERIIGSVKIAYLKIAATNLLPEKPEAKTYELGLRLNGTDLMAKADRSQITEIIIPLIREYQSACPVATSWIGRGDFNPQKIPATVSEALVLHACRTAGRLRARGIRQASPSKT